MRGPIIPDRSVSRESLRSKDPMRESTMSFFKEAFRKKNHHTDSMAAFYLSARREDENEKDKESIKASIASATGAPTSLLKMRRKGSSSNKKEPIKMSADIQSLIQEFH